MKTIELDDETYYKLEQIKDHLSKEQNKKQSFNDVIAWLLNIVWELESMRERWLDVFTRIEKLKHIQ